MRRLTPVKAIRAKCLDCCCSQIVEVRECVIKNCPLHPYRMGKRPKEVQEAVEFDKLLIEKGIKKQESITTDTNT